MAISPSPIDVAVNPNNPAQRYIYWNTGRIDAVGGAVPVTNQQTWFARFEPPGVAIHVTDWATGSGYTLDYRGGFEPFGSAPDIGVAATSGLQQGVPAVAGVPVTSNPRNRKYVDWSWNPNGTAQGYVLDLYGKLFAFGGAILPSNAQQRTSSPVFKRLEMRWTPDQRAIAVDMRGKLYTYFSAVLAGQANASLGNPTQDVIRDLVVMDWTAGNGYLLDQMGALHGFGGRARPYGWQFRRANVARAMALLDDDPETFFVVWSGGQQFEFFNSTPPTVNAGAGSSEVQTVTITGNPTGGTFTLTYAGQTTAAIARNATAATVDTALEALSNIGAGDVTVTGGPGPTTPWVVTFTGALADTDVAQMTATSSLTGGTSPTVTVATTLGGSGPSPAASVTTTTRPDLLWDYDDAEGDTQDGWQLLVFTQTFVNANTMTDPLVHAASAVVAVEGIDRTSRGIKSPVDLTNGSYRMYVRVQDSSGLWSAWDNHGWTQSVPAPATPTGLTATANQATYSVALSVTATTGGSANLIRFECSDDAGVTWGTVRGAGAVTLAATTTATDWDAPLGVTRRYRAVAYAVDPAVASTPSGTATATLTTLTHVLRAVDDSALGGRVYPDTSPEWAREVVAGVFQGVGAEYPTVVSDGTPKARRATLALTATDAAGWALIEGLVEADSVLVYRDPLGDVVYCKTAGEWVTIKRGAVGQHLRSVTLPLVEVAPPQDT